MSPAAGPLRRLLHPAYRSLERAAHVLRYLFVEITQRCNLACLHCGSDCGRDPRLAELTTGEWLRFFEYLPRNFDRQRLLLCLTGGEPFCAPRFDEILGGLKDHGLAFGMVSNGWALDDANLSRAVDAGLSSLTVSLDGLEASHDWLRGRAGSFRRAVAGIGRAAAAGLAFFDVVTCVNPRNLGELPELLELLRSLKVGAWRLFTIFPKGRAVATPGLALSEDGLRELFGWLDRTRRALAGTGFQVQYSCEGYLPAAWDLRVRDEPYFCRAGINIGSVLCDGSIAACPNISRGLIQGNLRSDDFHRVWEERFQPFRDREWMRRGECAGCAEFGRCQGNSLHLWDLEAGRTALCHHRVLSGGG